MYKVIKPHRVVRVEDMVQIPDADPSLPLDPDPDDPAAQETEEAAPEELREEAPPQEPQPTPEEKNLQSVEELSRRMMTMARLEREKLLSQTRSEVAQLRREAWDAGFQEGREAYARQVEEALEAANQTLGAMQARQQQYFEEYERELKYTALDIAAKVMHKTLSEDSTKLADLVREAVSSVKNVEWIQVEVSDRLVTLIHQLRKEYSAQEKAVEILPRTMPPDSCLVHTDQGVVDASIPEQLGNLRQLFEKMDQGRQ